MPVIIEYRGKWLEWCICSSLQGDVLLDSFGSEAGAHNWAANSGWVGDPREKARNLRQADYTYKQIANAMGKGESTIRRWLSE